MVNKFWFAVTCFVSLIGLLNTNANSTEIEEEFHKVYSTEGIHQIELENVNGSVQVVSTDSKKIIVQAVKKVNGPTKSGCDEVMNDLKITVTNQNGTCFVKTHYPKKLMYGTSVNYKVSIPSNFHAKLETTNGEISVKEIFGEISASSTNGNIRCYQTQSKLFAETTNGNISIEGGSPHLKAETTNGSIDLDIVPQKNALIFAETTNGAIELKIPPNTSARIKAETTNGKVSIEPWEANYNKKKNEANAVLGMGEGTIQLETVNGSIRVLSK